MSTGAPCHPRTKTGITTQNSSDNNNSTYCTPSFQTPPLHPTRTDGIFKLMNNYDCNLMRERQRERDGERERTQTRKLYFTRIVC